MTTVYISIGNSDDKLSQVDWALYAQGVQDAVEDIAAEYGGTVHGAWYSVPGSPYQNACWCVDVPVRGHDHLQKILKALAGKYQQDSIAWAPALTQFLRPEAGTT